MLLGIGLAGEHSFSKDGETPRRGVRGDFAGRSEKALAHEQFVDATAQFGLGPGNHAGGNLFQPNLQQKICHKFCVSFCLVFGSSK